MATSTWDAWYDDVATEVHGAPLALVNHHIKRAAIEFCKRSWAWVVDQGPISVASGANEYDWEPPTNTQIARVIQAWLDKRPLTPKTRGELSQMFGDYMRVTGPAQFFIQDVPKSFVLVPKPNSSSSDGVTAKVAIAPTITATGVDSLMFDRYHDAITKGALARLMLLSKKPWSDSDHGTRMMSEFNEEIAETKTQVIRSYSGARLRGHAQFF